MRYLRLKCIEDKCTGELGLNLLDNGMPNDGSEPIVGNGKIIAHDITEHQQGLRNIGSLDDEIIALGGVIYVRGVMGVLGNGFHSPEESISADITRMYPYYENSRMGRQTFTVPKHSQAYVKDSYEMDMAIESCHISRKDIPSENDDCSMQCLPEYLEKSGQLMSYGIYLAHRRFGSSNKAYSTFSRIEEAVNKAYPEYEGQEFILGYSADKATIREVYEEYYY